LFAGVHDIFYRYSDSIEWMQEGLAGNESLLLRAFLFADSTFQKVGFNPFAGHAFPDVFRDFPLFLRNTVEASVFGR
jgi:hypothetical protein